jgi:3-oxoacyl-[acyl-carrier-protein] synthase III
VRWDELYVASAATWLPPPVTTAAAAEAGLMTARRLQETAFSSALVASDQECDAPPNMAVRAGRAALRRAGTDPADVALVLHSCGWFQGIEMWPAANYVAGNTVGRPVPAFAVQQRCNGAMGALELAGAYLTAGLATGSTALLTTGERHAGPQLDRWNALDLCVFGDGATAIVVSREDGFARVLSTATVADNSLEVLSRGDVPFAVSPLEVSTVDLTGRQASRTAVQSDLSERFLAVLTTAQRRALADAGTTAAELAWTVIPASRRGHGQELHRLLGVADERTTWHYARTTGHLGPGDQFAGLAHLVETGRVAPGDRVMLFGGGAGYTCTVAVLEILRVPEWDHVAA